MPRILTTIMMIGALVLLPACGESDGSDDANAADTPAPTANEKGPAAADADQLVANLLGDLNKMTDRVSSVKDTVTAAQVVPDLKPYINKFKDYAEQYEQVKPATDSARAALMDKYGSQIESVMARLSSEAQRIEGLNPLVASAVKPVIDQINTQIEAIGLPALQTDEAPAE